MANGLDSEIESILEEARRGENLPRRGLPTLEAMIAAYVARVLSATGHNIARSARILGISRSTLYHYMKRVS